MSWYSVQTRVVRFDNMYKECSHEANPFWFDALSAHFLFSRPVHSSVNDECFDHWIMPKTVRICCRSDIVSTNNLQSTPCTTMAADLGIELRSAKVAKNSEHSALSGSASVPKDALAQILLQLIDFLSSILLQGLRASASEYICVKLCYEHCGYDALILLPMIYCYIMLCHIESTSRFDF